MRLEHWSHTRTWDSDVAHVAEAHLVVSELAADAVLHARQPFAVSLCRPGGQVLVLVAGPD